MKKGRANTRHFNGGIQPVPTDAQVLAKDVNTAKTIYVTC